MNAVYVVQRNDDADIIGIFSRATKLSEWIQNNQLDINKTKVNVCLVDEQWDNVPDDCKIAAKHVDSDEDDED